MPHLLESRGRVVNIASGLAYMPVPFAAAYVMSKRGVVAYSDVLRLEYGDRLEAVTTVYPGYIRTGIHDAPSTRGVTLEGAGPCRARSRPRAPRSRAPRSTRRCATSRPRAAAARATPSSVTSRAAGSTGRSPPRPGAPASAPSPRARRPRDDPRPPHRDPRHGLLRPRRRHPPQAGRHRRLRRARAGVRRRRHVAPQHLSRVRLRHPVAPVLVLVRAEPGLDAHLLAAAGDQALPARVRRALRAAAPHPLRDHARAGGVGRRRVAVAARHLGRGDHRRRSSSPAPARSPSRSCRTSRASRPSRARRSTRRAGTTTTTWPASASR